MGKNEMRKVKKNQLCNLKSNLLIRLIIILQVSSSFG